MSNINPLPRSQSLTERTYEHLKRLILDSILRPGQAVTETWLSESLGVSRTPVRQALSRLVSEGLVTVDGGRIQVRQISASEAEDVADLRLAIEGHCTLRLTQRGLTPEGQARLRAIQRDLTALVDAQGALSDVATFLRLNRELHLELARQTGNALLAEATARVLDLVMLSGLYALALPGRPREVLAEHAELLDALEAGNVPAAMAAMTRHVCSPSVRGHVGQPDPAAANPRDPASVAGGA